MSNAQTINLSEWMTVEEAAAALGVERVEIYNLVNYHRALESIRIGKLVKRADVEKRVAEQQAKVEAAQ